MDVNDQAAPQGGAPTDIVQIPPPAAAVVSTRDAARSLASFRLRQREGEHASRQEQDQGRPATQADGAPPAEESAEARVEPDPSGQAPAPADAAPPIQSEAPGETTESAEPPAQEAPIEPPRSWTKEARERFASLPRETQDYLASREQERDRELRRSQNEAAEQRKALEAERAKAVEARVQYETALPSVLASMQQQQASDFSDIKSIVDVERLAREDWPRYALWDAQQKRIASAQRDLAGAAQRQAQERQIRLMDYVDREQGLFIEKAPDVADPAQRSKLEHAAVGMLRELGFSDQELAELYGGGRDLSLHDHRLQLLIRDGVRFRDAQKAARQASSKPVPPVQRPGVAQPRGAAQDAVVANLTKRLDQTGTLKDAARLLAERRKAAR
jgi:hypothetical protein